MVKKVQRKSAKTTAGNSMPHSVKDSAQQIWQAGLAAFTRAQAEGSKAFESLVKEGVGIQRKTTTAAEEKIAEATSKMSSMATDISGKASGQWDKLETIFEDRVAKALNKLGVPSAKDVKDLIVRIDALNKAVQRLSAQSGAAAKKTATEKSASASPVKKAAAKSPAAKPTTAKKAVVKTAIAKKATPKKVAAKTAVTSVAQ